MQSRMLRVLFNQVLKTSKDGMSLGNLFQMGGSPKAFSAPDQAQLPQPLLRGQVLQPSPSQAPPLNSFQFANIFFVLKS